MRATGIGLWGLFFFQVALGADLGFRYVDGKCVNSEGTAGFNPKYLGQCGDLRNITISNFDLSGIDFSGALFNQASLQKNNWEGAILEGADLSMANLSGGSLAKVRLKKTLLKGANLKNVSVDEAILSSSDFTGADLTGVQWSFVSIESCRFDRALFVGAALDGATFKDSTFKGTAFGKADLSYAIFESALIEEAEFGDANLTEATLIEADGKGARFQSALLRKTQLQGSDLSKANFKNAKLEGADLRKAHLEDATFSNASLSDAIVDGAEFSGARYSRRTLLPFDDATAASLGMFLEGSLGLFYDSNFVYGNMNEDGYSLQQTLKSLTDFEEVTVAGLETSLPGLSVLIIPAIWKRSLEDLPAEKKAALTQAVKTQGLTLIYLPENGTFRSNTTLFDKILGIQVPEAVYTTNEASTLVKENQYSGLLNGLTQPKLEPAFLNCGRAGTLPSDAIIHYVTDSGCATVFEIPVGKGTAIWLSNWWNDMKPSGTIDGGWVELLKQVLDRT